MAILRGGGLRREEAVNLELKDLNVADGSLRVRSGKGNKNRVFATAVIVAGGRLDLY